MSNFCEICGVPNCPRLKFWPDGSRCRTHVAARAGLPATIPAEPPAPASGPPRQLRPLAETRRLHKLVNDCPHKLPRDPEAPGECGCIGRCAIGKGDLPEGRTSMNNCEKCQATELIMSAMEPPGE